MFKLDLCRVILLSALLSVCSGDCTEYGIRHCLTSSGLSQFLQGHGINIDGDIGGSRSQNYRFKFTEGQLREYCRTHDEYKRCLQTSVVPSCDSLTNSVLEGEFDAMNYLCYETFQEYVDNYQWCLKDVSMHPELHSCQDRASREFDNAETVKEFCQALESTVDCEVAVVKENCGSYTSNWMRTFNIKFLKPMAKVMGCKSFGRDDSDEEDDGIGTGVWVGIGVAVFVVVVLLLVGIAVGCYRSRRNARRLANRDVIGQHGASSAQCPPSYDHAVVVDDRKILTNQ